MPNSCKSASQWASEASSARTTGPITAARIMEKLPLSVTFFILSVSSQVFASQQKHKIYLAHFIVHLARYASAKILLGSYDLPSTQRSPHATALSNTLSGSAHSIREPY